MTKEQKLSEKLQRIEALFASSHEPENETSSDRRPNQKVG